jgi:23S rRNA-/tRNA-specific pseudouridylate synthase
MIAARRCRRVNLNGINRYQSVRKQSGDRINKLLTKFSRRDADKAVCGGRVFVNGFQAELGQRVNPGDTLTLDGENIDWESVMDIRKGGDSQV